MLQGPALMLPATELLLSMSLQVPFGQACRDAPGPIAVPPFPLSTSSSHSGTPTSTLSGRPDPAPLSKTKVPLSSPFRNEDTNLRYSGEDNSLGSTVVCRALENMKAW